MDIKAIPTEFDGYKFRSRTEARWAVFFKEMGVKYIYEYEGFELESGRYLPDFYFPDYDSYLEVKGKEPTQEERAKAFELVSMIKTQVSIVEGIPEIGPAKDPIINVYIYSPLFEGVASARGFCFPAMFAVGDDSQQVIDAVYKARQYKFGKIA